MNRFSMVLVLAALLLFSLGLLMVFNTTAAGMILERGASSNANLYSALCKQMICGVCGALLGLFAYLCGYERLLRNSSLLLGLTTLLLVLLFIPGVAQTVNGARRWLTLFGFSFQPSECVKILMPAFFIGWLSRRKGEIDLRSFCQILSCAAVPLGLILLQPDNGTVAVLIASMALLFFLAKIRWRYWAFPLAILMCAGGALAFNMPHVAGRIRVFLHPELDLKGKGHQPHQAKIAAGSGGLFGRGFGESLQKLNYLPEARNDYIAAIYAEETGFIGMVILVGLYGMFAYAGCNIALNAPTRDAFLFSSILTFLVSIQAFLNLAIVSGLLPSKGMTLPFFSQGGSSLIVNIGALFLLLDISRKSVGAHATLSN